MKFTKILQRLEGVVIHIDDILIHAKTLAEHDQILREVLLRLSKEGVTLNKERCLIRVSSVKFLGHVVSGKGVEIDQNRIESISKFPKPTNNKELMQWLEMVNFAARFIPNKSEILGPLTNLQKNNITFVWDHTHQRAFNEIIRLLKQAPNLAHFDANKRIVASADASSFGLGSVLMQIGKQGREIVAYASRTLSDTEKRYAQIEKEALGLTWGCEKFQEYILGLNEVILETDHKPLVQILTTKNLDELTPRLQRFRMRLMRYNYEVTYTPGKELVVADALSRNPLRSSRGALDLENELHLYGVFAIKHLPIRDQYLRKIIDEQIKDKICKTLREYSVQGWPSKNKLPIELLPYYQYRNEFSVNENILLMGFRIIIPPSLQKEVFELIHSGHQGITKCRERAKTYVWWLELSTQIENVIRICPNCIEERVNIWEPFHKDEGTSRVWQKVAMDLFKCAGVWYLIITDYFSRFFEIVQLSDMSQKNVINKVKEVFSRYGIPEIVRTDNGPQFQAEFKKMIYILCT